MQQSVYEIECNDSQYRKLKKQLSNILQQAQNNYPEWHNNIDSIKFYILSKVGEGNLEGRIDGLWEWYERVYIPDMIII